METSLERIAELERANYAATRPSAQVTPGLEVTLRPDCILTSSTVFPTRDSNHACLLQASAETADDLIAEVTAFFRAQELPVAVYLSPACTPDDLSQRLLVRGFKRQPKKETWMVLEDLPHYDMPSLASGVAVRTIAPSEAHVFAKVFMAAFDMPGDFAPLMAHLLEPSAALANVHHYLAFVQEEPVGTCSLLRSGRFGVLGSAGVLPAYRGRGVATNLAVRAAIEAREHGVDTLMLQTAADTWLEDFLRITGFRRAFTRSPYTLDYDATG